MVVLKIWDEMAVARDDRRERVGSRGYLNPGDPEVSFVRFTLDPALGELVRHVWVSRWHVPPGHVRPQRVLTYPACNAVFTPQEASLYGPQQRVGVRELAGDSWVVGVLLRPAASRVLTDTPPEQLVGGGHEPLAGAPGERIGQLMSRPAAAREELAGTLEGWLRPFVGRVDDAGRLVNEACRFAEEHAELVEVGELAEQLGITRRTLGRLVKERTGLTPKWLLECRRLQQAATVLYGEPQTDIAGLALRLGYADQAHFTRRYHAVIGETPDQTRRAGRATGSRTR